jgi:hypothetical protein
MDAYLITLVIAGGAALGVVVWALAKLGKALIKIAEAFAAAAVGHRQLGEVVWRYGNGWIGGQSAWPGSGHRGCAGDLVPGGESVGHFASVFLDVESVAARSEVRGYPAEGGQEPLGVPG